ncbi:MAG: lactate racemase domain-containing protein, partial [Myxococcota bacterium]
MPYPRPNLHPQASLTTLAPSSATEPPASTVASLFADIEPTGLHTWLARLTPTHPAQLTVVIPDDTRPLHPDQVLPPLLAQLAVHPRPPAVHVLVALGLHGPPRADFVRRLEQALAPHRDTLSPTWSFHDAKATEAAGLPLHPAVLSRAQGGSTDGNIVVGLVEPHQYAGFSGGYKGISIGCGATSTIAHLHSLEMLRRDGVAIGNIDGNPFREALHAIGQSQAAPTWTIALVPDPLGVDRFAGLYQGEPLGTFAQAAAAARERLMIPTARQFDFVLVGVPEAKAANFYQASRALTYLALHPSPCIRPGGTLIIEASCPDGYGHAPGEQAFRRALGRGSDTLLRELVGEAQPPSPPGGGAQRAYVLARALHRFRCVLIGGPELPEAQNAGLVQTASAAQLTLQGQGLAVADPFVAT